MELVYIAASIMIGLGALGTGIGFALCLLYTSDAADE